MEPACIFCQIAEGRTETELVYQNETLVVFRDIRPHAPVHWLVVPRRHIRSVNDLTEMEGPLVAEMLHTARGMAHQAGIAHSGYKLLFNVEKGGGQVIFHLHLHLMGGWQRGG